MELSVFCHYRGVVDRYIVRRKIKKARLEEELNSKVSNRMIHRQ